ncbi:hypothetical protein JCGZ_22034 [Jatropha curcas]|uniref:Uncharacterized protein n=1 Tax=Jatropha curcas TaxID=180498 RepID=A0A067K4F2_JATCU|nr:hypothetical protein JCGZ_22034 [Jatropha curcas]
MTGNRSNCPKYATADDSLAGIYENGGRKYAGEELITKEEIVSLAGLATKARRMQTMLLPDRNATAALCVSCVGRKRQEGVKERPELLRRRERSQRHWKVEEQEARRDFSIEGGRSSPAPSIRARNERKGERMATTAAARRRGAGLWWSEKREEERGRVRPALKM